jgi:hypothetical protein
VSEPIYLTAPPLVEKARELRSAIHRGKDIDTLEVIGDGYGGLLLELIEALTRADDRTLTYVAPQIAALAERVGYVSEQSG